MRSAPSGRFISWVGLATLLGGVPPLVSVATDFLIGRTKQKDGFRDAFMGLLDGIRPFLWPPSMFMGPEPGETIALGPLPFFVSMFANMGLYAVLGAIAWLVYVMARRSLRLGG